MSAALAVARVTVRQLTGRRRTLGLLVLMLVPAVITGIVATRPTTTNADAYSFFQDGTLTSLMVVILPIMALVISTAAFGDERRGETLSFLVLRPMRREVIVLSKLAAAWLSAFLLGGIGAAAAGIALGIGTGDWSEVLPLVGGAAVGTLAYCGVFLAVGYVTERAMIIGLAYVFVWEGLIASGVRQVTSTSLARIGVSAYAGLAGSGIRVPVTGLRGSPTGLRDLLGVVVPGVWGALAKAVVLSLAGGIVLVYFIRRRDLT